MDPFAGMSGLTRNPLGILAIFLGVLYGVAGLLLGASTSSLTELNQTLLTLLVVIFPFVSLATFAWLVAGHHAKLYSPTDYRTDEAFISSFKPASAIEAAEKLELEAEELQRELSIPSPTPLLESDSLESRVDEIAPTLNRQPNEAIRNINDHREIIRKFEDEIFSLISDRYSEVHRSIKFETMALRQIVIDGMGIRRNSGVEEFIEVVVFSRASMIPVRSREIAFNICRINHCLPDESKHTILLCLAISDRSGMERSRIEKSIRTSLDELEIENVTIKVFEGPDGGSVVEI